MHNVISTLSADNCFKMKYWILASMLTSACVTLSLVKLVKFAAVVGIVLFASGGASSSLK